MKEKKGKTKSKLNQILIKGNDGPRIEGHFG
jgi:hypothetical protein